jgi:N-acylneuraminate cytidylyltransferase/CMP-N,N'-diacetyllegionaminic acid synthase
MLPVLQHVLDGLAAEGSVPDIVVLLQPTSPLRRPEHIETAVRMLRDTGADSVVSVVELPRPLSPDYVMRIDGGVLVPFLAEGASITRRQDARPAYAREGTVYAFRRDTLHRFGNIYGEDCRPLVVPAAESLSIDTPEDWLAAERRLRGGRDL